MSIYCPKCSSLCVRRSRRRRIVERTVLTALLVRPFRCVECGWRFFRWSPRKNVVIRPMDGSTATVARGSGKGREVLRGEHAHFHLNLS